MYFFVLQFSMLYPIFKITFLHGPINYISFKTHRVQLKDAVVVEIADLKPRVLSPIPNRPVRNQWEYPRKMEHFSIEPGRLRGMTLTMFSVFFRIPYVSEEKYGHDPVCQNSVGILLMATN